MLLLAFPVLSMAQSNFQKGYVVTHSGDTLRGYVDYRERTVNPAFFTFKTEAGVVKKYTLADCSAYGIDNMDAFERHEVNITLSKIATAELSSGPDLSTTMDTVFLKVILVGQHVTLFSYTDNVKERFYIRTKAMAMPQELIRQLYLKADQSTSIVTDDKYVRQLLMVMRDARGGVSDDEHQLLRLGYKVQDFKKIIALINRQELVKSKYKRSRFFAGIGVTMTHASYSGDNYLVGGESKKYYLPYFTAGIDIFSNPAIKKLVFRTELSFFMSKNEISISSTNPSNLLTSHSFDEKTLAFTPQIIYHVYNAEKIKVFIGVGVGMNYSKYSNNIYKQNSSFGTTVRNVVLEDYVDFEKFHFSLPVTAGVVVRKNIEVIAGYSFPSSLTNYVYYSVSSERYRIGVNYLFGKH